MQTFKYPMNILAKDKTSGFQGVIISRTAHISGNKKYGIAPQGLTRTSNLEPIAHFFDEARLEMVLHEADVVHREDTYETIFMIPSGAKVQDLVTGFTGKVVMSIEYLYTSNQYVVEPVSIQEKKPPTNYWFDEGRLQIKN